MAFDDVVGEVKEEAGEPGFVLLIEGRGEREFTAAVRKGVFGEFVIGGNGGGGEEGFGIGFELLERFGAVGADTFSF